MCPDLPGGDPGNPPRCFVRAAVSSPSTSTGPSSRAVLIAYVAYLTLVGSALGWLLHRDPDTYRYIPESIRTYPGASAVVRLFQSEGFVAVRWHRVLGGLMAIHEARLPG